MVLQSVANTKFKRFDSWIWAEFYAKSVGKVSNNFLKPEFLGTCLNRKTFLWSFPNQPPIPKRQSLFGETSFPNPPAQTTTPRPTSPKITRTEDNKKSIPRESKDQTLPIGSRESFIWTIPKTILCLVLDFQGDVWKLVRKPFEMTFLSTPQRHGKKNMKKTYQQLHFCRCFAKSGVNCKMVVFCWLFIGKQPPLVIWALKKHQDLRKDRKSWLVVGEWKKKGSKSYNNL